MRKILLVIWLILCQLSLIYTMSAPYYKFTIVGFMLFMGILTFPSGLLVFYGAELILLEVFNVNEIPFYIAAWFLMVLAGYYQWFKFTPWLYGKVRGKRVQQIK